MLIGIVLRGSAFVFQSYGGGGGRVFATASLVTPVLLGMWRWSRGVGCCGGAGRGSVEPFYQAYIAPWLTPFGFAVGLFALACFAFLAAVYLTLEARDAALQEDFRHRAIAAGGAVFAMAVIGLALFPQARPSMTGWWRLRRPRRLERSGACGGAAIAWRGSPRRVR